MCTRFSSNFATFSCWKSLTWHSSTNALTLSRCCPRLVKVEVQRDRVAGYLIAALLIGHGTFSVGTYFLPLIITHFICITLLSCIVRFSRVFSSLGDCHCVIQIAFSSRRKGLLMEKGRWSWRDGGGRWSEFSSCQRLMEKGAQPQWK